MGPIGVFDSGYGGLTILEGIRKRLPQYSYIYLGDNARAPYGTRSFDVVYEFTLQAVKKLFSFGCPLIILGCNTASAKALRTIQQQYLPLHAPDRRVLGVIRPTVEAIGSISSTRHIGVLATEGTIKSESYKLEIEKLYPDSTIVGQACPMWVSLVENSEFNRPGADYFVKDSLEKLLSQDPLIDTIILGCTHFPLLLDKINQQLNNLTTSLNREAGGRAPIQVISQGEYIATSLEDYLKRHPEINQRLIQDGTCQYFTSESPTKFRECASLFLNEDITAQHVALA
ncbi:MAG: glutamate racemase [Bacteroidaceae bacterium]|nr:glutamate racemase [Bacteroidaceae bacterium]MDO5481591.1 glutamate racemase [Bacteroidaceae bacterium]